MIEEPVIRVQGVSKAYHIWRSPAARLKGAIFTALGSIVPPLKEFFAAQAAAQFRDFYALKDVSFEVRKGESVGIIGRNGSGKSTLLQIIAGTLQPSAGTVNVNGRVAALLELGSGFNPEFTGRENVMLNGAILGFTGAQMEAKFDEIAAFADIGDFINQPVKIYSSGMMLRLAFAVQTAVEPDVLIIDEALSVGDAPFQAKSFARIRHLQSTGCTILFVSHDVSTVQTFCQQALWLARGIPQAQGTAIAVCGAYNRDCSRAMGMDYAETRQITSSVSQVIRKDQSAWLREDRTEFEKNARMKRRGNGQVLLKNFFFVGETGDRAASMRWDEEITAVYVLNSTDGYAGLFRLSFTCVTLQGMELLSCSDRAHQHRLAIPAGGDQIVTMSVRLPLRAGPYSVSSNLFLFPDDAGFPGGTLDFSRSTVADNVSYSAFINILPQFNLGIYGPVHIDSKLSIHAP
jgi:ABC-type polysaccharide/polyol phosphate transport system ATPase subunit